MLLQDPHTSYKKDKSMAEDARKDLDALDLLMQDHREMESLFSEFEYLQVNGEDTAGVIESACAELTIHDALENDLFYPAVSDAADAEEIQTMLDDAEDAHDGVLDLIEELEQLDPDVAKRNACFGLLAERVKQHILQEETELFPRARTLERLDLDVLATHMKTRKSELMTKAELAELTEASV